MKKLKEKGSPFKFYSWDVMENYTYITYLMNFRYVFDSQLERKRVKVFQHLSHLIRTRNPHQIKSHHQKMMLRHQNVDNIISFLRNKINKDLECNPEYIPVIERINRESELFFLKEYGSGVARPAHPPPSQRGSLENDFSRPPSSEEASEIVVKMEDIQEEKPALDGVQPCLKE